MDSDAYMAEAYSALRAEALRLLRRRRSPHTATSLVHEAWLRLQERERTFADLEHFRALSAVVLRGVLVDWARAEGAQKRGGDWARVTLTGLGDAGPDLVDMLAIDAALTRLAALAPRQARVAELRLFAELSVAECAEAVGTSARTVEREWRMARAWIRTELERTS